MLDLIAYKNTHVPASNLFANGDFKEGIEKWYTLGIDEVVFSENKAIYTPTRTWSQLSQSLKVNKTDKIYMSINVKTLNDRTFILFKNAKSSHKHSGSGEFEKLSGVFVNESSGSVDNFGVSDGTAGDFKEITIKEPIFINLTETFGKGNEPTKEQMDKLLETRFDNGWFDGTKNLFNAKEFMNNYHKKTKELENAIIASEPVEFALSEKSVSIEHLDFIESSSNLINEKTIVLNKNINNAGELIDSDAYSLSDFIKVTPSTDYTASTTHIGAYYVSQFDKNKTFIKRTPLTNTQTITLDSATQYVRVADLTNFFGKSTQINLGSVSLPFEKYYARLSKEVMPKNVKPYYFAPEEIIGVYKGIGVSYTDFPTTNDVITAWNTLASEHPEYITETLMGYDASGEYPIYKYRLNPNGLVVNGMGRKLPKVLLVAGIHGGELPPIYSTYSMVRDICENWTEDALLEYLRWNVEFEIIPLANPYSLDHIQGRDYGYRHNANGVDLNSNFSENWAEGTLGDATYGGSEPFSEPESQYIKSMIDANTDAIYFGDYHSQGGSDYHLMWIPMSIGEYADENLQIASKYVIEKMSREFVKDYNLIPDRTVLGSTRGGRHNGTTRIYAHAQGIPSASTVEGFNVFPADAGQTYESVVKANTEFITNWLLTVIKQMKSVY